MALSTIVRGFAELLFETERWPLGEYVSDRLNSYSNIAILFKCF